MPYDGYGGDEGFPHDGKQGRCGYYLIKIINNSINQYHIFMPQLKQ